MTKFTMKIAVIATAALVAVLPAPASASVSGYVQCQQGKTVETYVQGYGWYHNHQLSPDSYFVPQSDPYTSYYTIFIWYPRTSGYWSVSASTTTTYGAGYCV